MSQHPPQETTEESVIHRQMTIQEILTLFPHKAQRLAQEITKAGLHCVGCHAATWETLEAGMRGHGFEEEAIDALVARLNDVLKENLKADASTISLTARAAQKFLEFSAAEGKQGWGLHFCDRMKGCSGFTYELNFAEGATEQDQTFVSHGVEIYVPKDQVKRLLGSVIDYVNSLNSSGFYVENFKASSSCGCGSSHNYSEDVYQEASPSNSQGSGCCGSSSKNYQKEPSHQHHHGGGCCSH